MERTRLLLIDDDERYLRTLESFLQVQADFDVVATLTRADTAVSDYSSLEADVAIIDACMPQVDGIEATWRLVTEYPEARVIVISAHESSEMRDRATKAGALEFVSKRDVARDLPSAIRRAAGSRMNAHVGNSQEPSADGLAAEVSSAETVLRQEADTPPASLREITVSVTVSLHGGGW